MKKNDPRGLDRTPFNMPIPRSKIGFVPKRALILKDIPALFRNFRIPFFLRILPGSSGPERVQGFPRPWAFGREEATKGNNMSSRGS